MSYQPVEIREKDHSYILNLDQIQEVEKVSLLLDDGQTISETEFTIYIKYNSGHVRTFSGHAAEVVWSVLSAPALVFDLEKGAGDDD